MFNFAQGALPLLLDSVEGSPHPPSLIVTGATASLRGSAIFADFAAGKFAKRAITQSLAREFGPKGVHVAHAVIDGGIDGPRMAQYKSRFNNGAPDGMLSPDAVSERLGLGPDRIRESNMLTSGIDRGQLLVPAHSTSVSFHAGAGPEALRREVLRGHAARMKWPRILGSGFQGRDTKYQAKVLNFDWPGSICNPLRLVHASDSQAKDIHHYPFKCVRSEIDEIK